MEGIYHCPANYVPLSPISFLERAAAVYGDKVSIVYGRSVRFSWKDTLGRCVKVASALVQLKICPGDIVVALAPNVPALYELHFGVPMAGAVLSALNTRLDAPTLALILEQLEAKLIFVDYQYTDAALKALELLSRKNVSPPHVVVIPECDKSASSMDHKHIASDLDYNCLLEMGRDDFRIIRPSNECDPISVSYTSGSTGNPKGVVYSHRAAYLNSMAEIFRFEMRQMPVFLWTVDMFRCNGWCLAWAMAAIGGTNISSSSTKDLCRSSKSFRTLDTGVPKSTSTGKKLAWLRSQIIGDGVEFDSAFGKRRLTYADHTASGRSLLYIENFIIDNVLPFYGNTHTSDSHVGHRTTKMLHEAAEYIKKCLGGGADDAILFCGSGTTAAIKKLQEVMGIAVPSTLRDRLIKCLGDEERWLVFVGPYEHHSNLLSWRQSLAEVVEIGLDDNGLIDIEDLRRRLESYKHANRPILGSFSACSNVTGIFSDTRGIARLLHQHGGFACFDFAASGPYVKIDMRSGEIDGYDAIFLSPHKFLGGPGSPGILLMSKALYQLGSSAPSICGGGTVDFVNGFSEKHTLYVTEIEERENGGTPQIIQTIRAALTFWVKEYITCRVIEEKENMYTAKALNRLLPNKNTWILGNTTGKRQAILSFLVYSTTNSSSARTKHGSSRTDRENINDEVLYMWGETGNRRDKPLHGPFVAALLNDLFGIQARGGCACAGPYGHSLLHVDEPSSLAFRSAIKKGYVGVKPGWTRVSFPYYMSSEEFEFILAAIEFTAIYGQRFLPLYHFNWKTGSWTFKKREFKELAEKENSDDANKFASYLTRAKHIANLLHKFPSQREIPRDLDLSLLHFRV